MIEPRAKPHTCTRLSTQVWLTTRCAHVAYQTDRCRPGTEVRDVKVFTDRGIDPNLARKVEADRRALAARRRQTPGYSLGVPRAESDKVRRCREAKADRDRVLKQLGLRTTYDLRRRLDDRVYDACKYAPGA